jgi:hypothetical protein
LGENIADAGGLTAAFQSWRRRDAEKADELLPGLDHFTKEQVFFLAYGLTWCGKAREEQLEQRIYTDPHSPDMFRIRVSVVCEWLFVLLTSCRVRRPTLGSSERHSIARLKSRLVNCGEQRALLPFHFLYCCGKKTYQDSKRLISPIHDIRKFSYVLTLYPDFLSVLGFSKIPIIDLINELINLPILKRRRLVMAHSKIQLMGRSFLLLFFSVSSPVDQCFVVHFNTRFDDGSGLIDFVTLWHGICGFRGSIHEPANESMLIVQ